MNILKSPEEEDTLPDDAWKDSFDKLLDDRPVLRNNKIIKRDIRVSLNRNSSYENSCFDDTSRSYPREKLELSDVYRSPHKIHLEIPEIAWCTAAASHSQNCESVSTPMRITDATNPFKCTLSPIGVWEFQHLRRNNKRLSEPEKFNSTPVPYADISNANQVALVTEDIEHLTRLSKSPLSIIAENVKPSRKQVCFKTKVVDSTPRDIVNPDQIAKRSLSLRTGKWRKSLNILRRTQTASIGEITCIRLSTGQKQEEKKRTLAASHRKSVFHRKYSSRASSVIHNNFERELLQRCGQKDPVPFLDAYSDKYLQHCCKIGEGAFGEVFLYKNPNGKKEENVVLKVIPFEGKTIINGEPQKSFEQILQEVVICMELCSLNSKNRTNNISPGFVNLSRVRCVRGEYPGQLQRLWEEYDKTKESDNDHPDCFSKDQKFVILEMSYSGEDLERFTFLNAEQAYYALLQIIYTLAVGEKEFQFEHRDLHWGNVLVMKTRNKYMSYKLGEKKMTLPSKGVRITIIDYTLSRITYNNGCYYNDLACDPELFTATGDYQFDIYRMMRETLSDNWEKFDPKTNVFWISYIISKMLDGVSYSKKQQKIHLKYIEKLKDLKSKILTYKSCVDCALDIYS